MPIYEYTCNKCGEKFEFLHGFEDEPRCPKCKGKDLKKNFSTFGCSTDSSGPSCGCTPPPKPSTG